MPLNCWEGSELHLMTIISLPQMSMDANERDKDLTSSRQKHIHNSVSHPSWWGESLRWAPRGKAHLESSFSRTQVPSLEGSACPLLAVSHREWRPACWAQSARASHWTVALWNGTRPLVAELCVHTAHWCPLYTALLLSNAPRLWCSTQKIKLEGVHSKDLWDEA